MEVQAAENPFASDTVLISIESRLVARIAAGDRQTREYIPRRSKEVAGPPS